MVQESRFIAEMPEEPRTATHHVSEAAMSIQNRIVPQMSEKLHLLAASFDEELEKKDASEREARRILNTTIKESKNVQAQFNDLSHGREEAEQKARGEEQYSRVRKQVISLIEQQHHIQLHAAEGSQANGHLNAAEDDLAERVMLAKMPNQEQNKRRKLVGDFVKARSIASVGEKGDMFRRLLLKALGPEISLVDENLNRLVQELTEEVHGQRLKTIEICGPDYDEILDGVVMLEYS